MKVYRFFEKCLAFVLLCLCSWTTVLAQQNASGASVSRSRAIVNTGPTAPVPATTSAYPSYPSPTSYPTYTVPAPVFRIPEEVAVEEFVNYHKHRLPLPKVGQAVALDTRWGNGEVARLQREAVLQIGFTTAEADERTDLRPLNLVLVIDKSGSMADSDKMSRVKESLHAMLSKLRSNDIISIVAFDTSAQVLYPASSVGNGAGVRYAIDCLVPGGATNLHSGLMLGYAEARKHFSAGATNRVILLTDGIANQGVTEPSRIARDSAAYNGQGIDLSTIGVGLDLNNDLLRTGALRTRPLSLHLRLQRHQQSFYQRSAKPCLVGRKECSSQDRIWFRFAGRKNLRLHATLRQRSRNYSARRHEQRSDAGRDGEVPR